jgi:predicted Zn finger-like uncharacterized protein
MRHACEHCHTAYEIADHKVAGRFVKVRCKMCNETMHVVGVKADAAPSERFWCAIKGQPRGPFNRQELELLVSLGDVSARTRLWQPGMKGWERVCESSRFAWVYALVEQTLSADELILACEPTRTNLDPFASAALASDAPAWFPDPTLKSGIFLLDDASREQLARSGLERAARAPSPADRGAFGAIVAAAAGAAMAVGGFVWLVIENLV